MGNENSILAVLFGSSEVEGTVKRLKNGKACGDDGLLSEYLKEGGSVVVIWLMKILNAVIELEAVPDTLKRCLITPIYKGGGKDSLKVDSYRELLYHQL